MTLRLERLGDLLSEPEEERRWLVDQRLVVSGFSLLAGKPKAGKSTLGRCLVLAVARGEPWLGWSTQQGTVMYLALEEKRDEVRRHFATMGATGDDPILVSVAPSPLDGFRQLTAATKEHRPALIVIDPMFRFLHGIKDSNDYAAMTQALDPLLRLARDTGTHVMGVHHLRKGHRVSIDDSLGSTAITGIVDAVLFLKRSDAGRALSMISRYGSELEPTVVTLDPDSGLVSRGPLRRDVSDAAISDAIVGFLGAQAGPVEEPTILDGVHGDTAAKERLLRKLVDTGAVSRIGRGVKGDPYRYVVGERAGEKGRKEGSTERAERAERDGSGQAPRRILPCSPAALQPSGRRPVECPQCGRTVSGALGYHLAFVCNGERPALAPDSARPVVEDALVCELCGTSVPRSAFASHVAACEGPGSSGR